MTQTLDAHCEMGTEPKVRVARWELSISTVALLLGTASVIGALSIGYLAYRNSVATTQAHYERLYLHKANVLASMSIGSPGESETDVLRKISDAWLSSEDRPADEYVCVSDRDARLLLHTLKPDYVGRDVSNNLVLGDGMQPFGKLGDLIRERRNYVGDYVSSFGQHQIAAFAVVTGRGWLLGVHRSREALIDEIRAGQKWLAMGLLWVCGVFMPMSLLVLHATYRASHRRKVLAELKLVESEETLRRVTNDSPDLLYRMSIPDGRYEYVSPAATKLFGHDPDEFYATPLLIRRLMHSDWVCFFDEQWSRLSKGEMPPTYEYAVTHPTQGMRWMHQRNALIRSADGRPTAIEGIVTDVTARKHAEEERRRLEEELRQSQKMQAVGTLASGVAHDFNNLLTAIMGYAEIARAALPTGGEALDAIDGIDRVAEQAAGVTRSILTFCRKNTAVKSPVDLASLVRDSAEMLRRVIPATITMAPSLVADEKIWVEADAVQIQQVLMNLTINSRDAMPDGGTLRISVCRGDGDPSDVFSAVQSRGHGMVVMTVEDSGLGMSQDVLDRVFEPFFTTKSRERGTGLGLAVVHGIIEEHGGVIHVDSQPGHGTRVTMAFPGCGAPSQAASMQSVAERGGQGETVLVAEDAADVRAIVVRALASRGFQAVESPDGTQAVEAFGRHQEHIVAVILDVDLPHMNGLAALSEMRKLNPALPAVIITGAGDFTLDESAHPNTQLLRKPFQMSTLTAILGRMIPALPNRQAEHVGQSA